MAEAMGRELAWDDEIENESGGWVLLPEGEYDFVVEGFERGRHNGSSKIPPCNKAILTLGINSPQGHASVTCNLFLYDRYEWKLCQFFTSIGQRRHGEAMRMNWGAVPGSTGVCHVGVRKWTGNDGRERESNEITEFYDPAKAPGSRRSPPIKVVPPPRAVSMASSGRSCPRGPPPPGARGISKWS